MRIQWNIKNIQFIVSNKHTSTIMFILHIIHSILRIHHSKTKETQILKIRRKSSRFLPIIESDAERHTKRPRHLHHTMGGP